MFFFQVLLLAGYAYAHALANRFAPRAQAIVHCVLLAGGLGLLVSLAIVWGSPVTPSPELASPWQRAPGLEFDRAAHGERRVTLLLLATTGPLLQSWFTRTHPGRSPYRLYALSNLGSLLGLLSYPFLIEPWISLRHQALLWALAFVVYVVVCGYCAARVRTAQLVSRGRRQPVLLLSLPQTAPSVGIRLLWLALAACASVMFLATTNQICQDIAVVPFLWVLPLSLYLVSFIICFERSRWYSRPIFHPALAVAIFLACFLLGSWGIKSILLQVMVHSFVLFVVCMVCHGELARVQAWCSLPNVILSDDRPRRRSGRYPCGSHFPAPVPRILGVPPGTMVRRRSIVRGAGTRQIILALLQPLRTSRNRSRGCCAAWISFLCDQPRAGPGQSLPGYSRAHRGLLSGAGKQRGLQSRPRQGRAHLLRCRVAGSGQRALLQRP